MFTVSILYNKNSRHILYHFELFWHWQASWEYSVPQSKAGSMPRSLRPAGEHHWDPWKMTGFIIGLTYMKIPSLTAMIFSYLFRGASSGQFVLFICSRHIHAFDSIVIQDVLEMLLAPIQMSIYDLLPLESTTSTISRSVSSWSHHETLSFRSWCWTSKTFIEDTKARMRIQKSPRRISLQATSVLKRFVMQLCSAQKSCWIKSWWMKSMDSHVGICYFFQALI